MHAFRSFPTKWNFFLGSVLASWRSWESTKFIISWNVLGETKPLYLHSIRPGPLRHNQGNMNETFVCSLAREIGDGHVTFLEVPFVPLRQLKRLPQSPDPTSAISAVALIVPMPQAVLLLRVPNQSENYLKSVKENQVGTVIWSRK